jgi:hypothetical protein
MAQGKFKQRGSKKTSKNKKQRIKANGKSGRKNAPVSARKERGRNRKGEKVSHSVSKDIWLWNS